MHHLALRKVELEWEMESSDRCEVPFKVDVNHMADGSYVTKIEDSDSPSFEIRVTHIGNNNYRVNMDGLSSYVTLALYTKEDVQHTHIWHDKHHFHYKQRAKLNQYTDDESRNKPDLDIRSRPKGSVVAPMSGLVIKVFFENCAFVEENQPILVLKAMKMEHVVKAPRAGYVDGLQVSPGQQVFDLTVLSSVKEK